MKNLFVGFAFILLLPRLLLASEPCFDKMVQVAKSAVEVKMKEKYPGLKISLAVFKVIFHESITYEVAADGGAINIDYYDIIGPVSAGGSFKNNYTFQATTKTYADKCGLIEDVQVHLKDPNLAHY